MGNALLAAGKLDRRVTIVRDGAATVDSWGQEIPGVPVETIRWASVRPAPGTERSQSGANAALAPMRFVFRWKADLVRETDALRTDDGVEWDVKSVTEIGRREGWEVLAVAKK